MYQLYIIYIFPTTTQHFILKYPNMEKSQKNNKHS